MAEAGPAERQETPWPALVVVALVGIGLGAAVGATIRGSGAMYTSLFLAGCLVVVVTLAALGALAATHAGQGDVGRVLAGFATAAAIGAAVAYVIAPPFHDPNADDERPGTVTVRLAEPRVVEWQAGARCRSRPGDPNVFLVFQPDVHVDDAWVATLLRLEPGQAVTPAELTLAFSRPEGGSADYRATPDAGVQDSQIAANGRSGSIRFSAPRVPTRIRTPDPKGDSLVGTLEWTCES